ncbi:hypothetical protein JW826_05610 [Candidatus Woesearchaeota archaeon]|nr:hypothetical protein [Candidatus Woesearchaeota archaeon]
MGEFMGRKVNLFLVLMIIIVVLGMGALSIYYQRTFKDVNQEYNELSEQNAACQLNLSTTVNKLQTTIKNLNSTESDIRKYDTLYEQKAQELQDTEKSLNDVKTKLQSETLFKEQFKRQAEQYYSQVQVLNANVSSLEKTLKNKDFLIDTLQTKVDCLEDTSDGNEDEC